MKKIHSARLFFKTHVFSRGMARLLEIIAQELEDRAGHTASPLTIFTPNPEQIVLANRDETFARDLGSADIRIPDGIGLVWASRVLSAKLGEEPIKERVSGGDLLQSLLERFGGQFDSVLVIGGRDYARITEGETLADITDQVPAHLRTTRVLWTSAYESIATPNQREEEQLSQTITKNRPGMVFVAFGAPRQERWVIEHQHLLEKNGVKLVMVVGGAFDVLVGKLNTPPKWVKRAGFEWLYRLIQEPWRWKRQTKLLEFVGLTIRELFR